MTTSQMFRIAVLSGERNPMHHDRSVSSGTAMVQALREGPNDAIHHIPTGIEEWQLLPQILKRRFDLALVATHGTHLRAGEVERLLRDYDVPATSSDPLAAALTANPFLTHRLLTLSSLPSPHMSVVSSSEWLRDRDGVLRRVAHSFEPPFYVRPLTGMRQLFGVKALTLEECEHLFGTYLSSERSVVLHRFIPETLYYVPVLDHGDAASAYPLPAVMADSDRYITESVLSLLRRLAVTVHKTMGLSGFSESVMSYSKEKGPLILSVNIIPDLTAESPLRRSLSTAALGVQAFLNKIISAVRFRR